MTHTKRGWTLVDKRGRIKKWGAGQYPYFFDYKYLAKMMTVPKENKDAKVVRATLTWEKK